MFYPIALKEESRSSQASALLVLTSAESKRLIAKGVAALPEVKRALKDGRVIVARGTTNAFVAEELLGSPIPKARYVSGLICDGRLEVTGEDTRIAALVLVNGKPAEARYREVLNDFDAPDIFIKGANAVDPQGHAGILVQNPEGGTIGEALPITAARGATIIVPVGLEKLIPSVIEASQKCGRSRLSYATGYAVGYMPLVSALVVTEVQALGILAGVKATHVASGGVAGSEGSVVLAVEGAQKAVQHAISIVESVKGEAAVPHAPTTPAEESAPWRSTASPR